MASSDTALAKGSRTPGAASGSPWRVRRSSLSNTLHAIWRARFLYLLALPGILYYAVFQYLPMAGNAIAFMDYSPFLGFAGSTWIGLANFQRIFADTEVLTAVINTVVLSMLQIAFAFPAPIVLSILLNEVTGNKFRRLMQSLLYLPHFISWVIVVGLFYLLFGSDGVVNQAIREAGGATTPFLTSTFWFRPMIIGQVIWREVGWGTIIYLAALTAIDPQLYEAARMDGAGRWRLIWHITLPGVRAVTVVLLILQLGKVLDVGFEQIFLQRNASNIEVSEVIDTFVYFRGIGAGDFGFAAAVGLFKGLVGLVMVLLANRLARRAGESGLF